MRTTEGLESQFSDSRVLGFIISFPPHPSRFFCNGHSVLVAWRPSGHHAPQLLPGADSSPGFRLPCQSQRNPLPPGGDQDATVKGTPTSAGPQEMQTGQGSSGPAPLPDLSSLSLVPPPSRSTRAHPQDPSFSHFNPPVAPPG